jgi:glycosyltransferase involved in cell wall biosynthesis
MSQTPLLYMLHSGNLYGTERMALATADGLRDDFRPVMFAPAGPALTEAARLGFEVKAFGSARELANVVSPYFSRSREVAVIATGVMHSFCAMAQSTLHRRRMAHLHVVHGGTEERLSYGRKGWLNRSSARMVAVSSFVKTRLIANGVRADKIEVVENFLSDHDPAQFAHRAPFQQAGMQRALVISRVDPVKRVDLLLDALDQHPSLRSIDIRVLGAGWDLDKLRSRASASHPNVSFAGFVENARQELAQSDLLIHLCPSEPFGLAILEAMAALVPVLVPDQGGAGSLVADGVSGFKFIADDASSLARKLIEVNATSPSDLNRVAANGRELLETRFSTNARVNDYRMLLHKGLS